MAASDGADGRSDEQTFRTCAMGGLPTYNWPFLVMNSSRKSAVVALLMLALAACKPKPSSNGEPSLELSPSNVFVCDIGKAGARWNGKAVHLEATLVVDREGGELRDARCPATILGFFEEAGDVEQTDTYMRFSNSFDRDLFTVGVSKQRVELVGLVESPGTASGGKPYASAIRLRKIIRFDRLSPMPR